MSDRKDEIIADLEARVRELELELSHMKGMLTVLMGSPSASATAVKKHSHTLDERGVPPPKPCKCLCDREFPSKAARRRHHTQSPKCAEMCTCRVCEHIFPNRDALDEHLKGSPKCTKKRTYRRGGGSQ